MTFFKASARPWRLSGHLAAFGLCAALTSLLPVSSLAQAVGPAKAAWPSRPITLISPLPAGASTDVVTRAWMACAGAPDLAGQPFVLMNRPGANGVVAAQSLRTQAADGYSIMLAGMSQTTITPYIFKKQPYDPLTEFQGAAMFGVVPLMLVANVSSGIRSVKDIQAAAKANPKGIDIAVPALASPAHLLSAALAERLGIQATLVPVSGETDGATSLMGNQLPLMVFLAGSAAEYIKAGRLVPVMTFTEQRLPQFPAVPTVVEELGDASLVRQAWIGITTKAGSPPEVIPAIDKWTRACLEKPEFREVLERSLFTPHYVGPAQFTDIVKRDIAFWRPLIEKLGISND